MIEFLSSWVKGLGLSIIIVSILEMLLPNNKTKKYIRIVMGVYIIFTIISPFLNKREILSVSSFDFENYEKIIDNNKVLKNNNNIYGNQTDKMENRIKELYEQELEEDITKKIKELGYEVLTCFVKVQMNEDENNLKEAKITKIKLDIKKSKQEKKETVEEDKTFESKVVVGIQKIKPVDTSIQKQEDNNSKNNNDKNQESKETEISNSDIQYVKKFIIKEYEVNEKCLEIS